jgi:uncharacterized RDD family membrane protein YckC
VDASVLKPGDRISEYVLEERVGRGGFGDVWRARHHAWPDRVVAVKVPGSPDRAQLLKREGALQDRVRHAGAVEVLGMDAEHDPPYLIMEYVDGESLRGRLARERRLAPPVAVELAVEVLGALEHAHARGVVHRDVKPENILLTKEGRAKLTDFGLGRMLEEERARLALSGSLASGDGRISGTIAYMAPEQREAGRPVDARADLYAVGIVLFEMLTGARPEGSEVPGELVAGLDPRLDEVFRRCYCRLEKRYASAAAMIADLAPLASRRAVAAAAGPIALPPGRLEPSHGAPADMAVQFLPAEGLEIEGGARIEHRVEGSGRASVSGGWWISAGIGARATTIRPAQVPAGRRPEEVEARVGAAPLRLAEGVTISVAGETHDVPPCSFVFHDGVATEPGSLAQAETLWVRDASVIARVLTALSMVSGCAAAASALYDEFPLMVVFGLVSLALFLISLPINASRRPLLRGAPPARVVVVGRPAGFFARALALAIDLAFFGYLASFGLGARIVPLAFLYDWLMTALLGGTVGKVLLGIAVVTEDGERIGLAGGLVRTLSKVLSLVPAGLGFALAGVTPSKQALHDFFARTRVIHRGE